MRKVFCFVCSIVLCTYTTWALPLNLRNVQECKQMIEKFMSDRSTGYLISIDHLSGAGITADSNYITFEVDDEGRVDIEIQYVQRIYWQNIHVQIEKEEEFHFGYIDFWSGSNGSNQSYSLYFEQYYDQLVRSMIDDLFESLGY